MSCRWVLDVKKYVNFFDRLDYDEKINALISIDRTFAISLGSLEWNFKYLNVDKMFLFIFKNDGIQVLPFNEVSLKSLDLMYKIGNIVRECENVETVVSVFKSSGNEFTVIYLYSFDWLNFSEIRDKPCKFYIAYKLKHIPNPLALNIDNYWFYFAPCADEEIISNVWKKLKELS